MARSYKKNKIYRDHNRFFFKLANRIIRHISKQKLKTEEDPILPIRKSEVINDYDVSDYSFFDFDGKWFGKGKLKKIFK